MKASDGTQDRSVSYTNSPSTTPKERIQTILIELESRTYNYGRSSNAIHEATHALLELMEEIRGEALNELVASLTDIDDMHHHISDTAWETILSKQAKFAHLKSERKNTE